MGKINSDYVKEEFNQVAYHYKEGYEYWRWESTEGKKVDFEQTAKSIKYHLNNYKFDRLLEIGCGAGTWTRLLVDKTEKLDLLDISKNMIEIVKSKLGDKNINYLVGDFQQFDFPESAEYDGIVSVRALEYMENKEKVIKKIYKLLKKRGTVFIITKNPKRELRQRVPFLDMFLETPKLHRDWIGPEDLSNIFKEAGFKDIEIYPVVIQPFFIFRTGLHNKMASTIHNRTYNRPFNNKYSRFIESYMIKGKK